MQDKKKTTSRHIIIKLLKNFREKQAHLVERNKDKNDYRHLELNCASQKIFKVLKEREKKKCHSGNILLKCKQNQANKKL